MYTATRVIWYIVGILEALLAFRFVLRLLGANPAAGFTHFIYALSYPFAAPFLAVFKITQVEGSVLEWTTLLAMAVYWLLGLALVRLLLIGRPVSTPEAAAKLSRQDS